MANPDRILTHKKQRRLTDEKVRTLLTDYVSTDATYKALSEKFRISQKAIGNIVSGQTYREISGIASLRKKAQEKASDRSGRYSNAKALRVPDASKTRIEVDFNSVESLDAAILSLQCERTLLIDRIAEVSSTRIGGGLTVRTVVQTVEVPC